MKRRSLLALPALAALAGPSAAARPDVFTNPVVRSGADPWVIRRGGRYYCCRSRGGSVWVGRSARLQEIGRGPWARVWTPPLGTSYSRNLWAPELHYLRGRWYIYVAADDSQNRNHRMFALEGTSQDPQAPFRFKGKLAATPDRWAIDGTVLEAPGGTLYFVWSGWEGFEDVAQNLYVAPMSDPLTVGGERVCISKPEYAWEKHGKPLVNEGPEVLRSGDGLFLIYSASGSWTDDYCLGQLTWTGGDVLDPKSWVKKPTPVFSRTAKVFGPGHASFTKSPDGTQDWIVYHAAKRRGAGWDRDVRIQKFTWNPDGSPRFGTPIPPGALIRAPSGDPDAPVTDRPPPPRPARRTP
jgi:GH43 family beta-xylosidase